MSKKSKKGFLITLEGGEGGGKTTQIETLRQRLTDAGHDIVVLREPGGTKISEQIREVVLSAKNVGVEFTTEVLLFQAARAQIYSEVVLPSLAKGMTVLMDRSRDSSVAYQGIVRGFGERMIEDLNNISTGNTYPDITLLLDLPEKVGLSRREKDGGMDRLDSEKMDFHTKVRKAYLHLAKKNDRGRWTVIDATQTIDEVADDMWAVVSKALGI